MKQAYHYEPWKDFEIFEAWIAEQGLLPNPGEILMRIDAGEPWGPENIKKSTRAGMANSRKSTLVIELEDGIQIPLAQACKMFRANYPAAYMRLDRGCSVEEALGLKNLKLKARRIPCNALMVRLDGELVKLAEAGRRLGIAYKTLFARIYCYDWPIEKALETDTMRPITYEGMTRPELAKKHGIGYWTLVRRLARGWPLEKALTTPMANRGQNKKYER